MASSPSSRGPRAVAGAPLLFRLHALSACLLFAVWPFTRLVHVWSVPIGARVERPDRLPLPALPGERQAGRPCRRPVGTRLMQALLRMRISIK
ncbi:respiratory nitrate reductase subunit gamma [Streptomyces sp. NPDC048192]|uniref:respiratory nitrate reductase subunit gamma n=1 Tax=Streptomyces sp. NPDC048192 TaxID=3365510 RepID=UPI00371BDD5C